MKLVPAFQIALGCAVKDRREELGITQAVLAERTGLHPRWISNTETGKRNPSYASLRLLAGGLALPTSELLGRAEEIDPSRIAARSDVIATLGYR